MFASVGEWAARRSAAVVLSGALDDGAVGAAIVARADGQVRVQDPAEAEFDSMLRSALAAAPGASAVPLSQPAQQIRDSLEVARSLHSDPARRKSPAEPLHCDAGQRVVERPDAAGDAPPTGSRQVA